MHSVQMTENPMINNTIKTNTNTPSDSITKIGQLPMYINEKKQNKNKTKNKEKQRQPTKDKRQTTNSNPKKHKSTIDIRSETMNVQ